ncbi:MAG: ABC di/oligopeptide transporter ATPase [Paracoccaceae bacterium]|nr:MAG: ABC di/oligopeptide transporter ATPase [Paracoccaceae bacterium]
MVYDHPTMTTVQDPPGERMADAAAREAPLLEVAGLSVSFGGARVVDGLALSLRQGEILGIVGESGSGKSMTALAIMRLLPPGGMLEAAALRLLGEDIAGAPESRLEDLRGATMGMIFQEPMTALNPVLHGGRAGRRGGPAASGLAARPAWARAVETLGPGRDPRPRPPERMTIPITSVGGDAPAGDDRHGAGLPPRLLIADEPTTALDVTIQAQILDLMLDLQEEYGMGIILISHDLGVVSAFCERVMIMYLGRVMEEAPTAELFARPLHPYTEALLASIPRIGERQRRLRAIRGSVPPIFDVPPGCRFAPRCDHARPACDRGLPPLAEAGPGRRVACIRPWDYRFPGVAE